MSRRIRFTTAELRELLQDPRIAAEGGWANDASLRQDLYARFGVIPRRDDLIIRDDSFAPGGPLPRIEEYE